MLNEVEMGKIYWKCNDNTDTYDSLIKFLTEDLGLILVSTESFDGEEFDRISNYRDKSGSVQFSIVWYKNLSNLIIGEKDKAIIDVAFDRIIGSYLPEYNCLTIDFCSNGKRSARLAINNSVEVTDSNIDKITSDNKENNYANA